MKQENQDYYNWRDQQYIGDKYNDGLEQVIIELIPDIILEEQEDGFYQWVDQYDQWDNKSYTPVEEGDVGGSHTFNVDNRVFNIKKIKQNGTSKTRTVSELSESSNKSDFYVSKRQSEIQNVWSQLLNCLVRDLNTSNMYSLSSFHS